ncbi:MAG: hypothetical protein CL869_00625 [Cytophagia bacterium]|nr:hypothetical protein [Cytophagia bacterium]|tara:strand:+ start:3263 stop:3727 length:465 start_codon:yes stop_codon:yes gene_type:complete
MKDKLKDGFTLVELVLTAFIAVTLAGSIMYGIVGIDLSINNVELREKAFQRLANRMEELKGQVALNNVLSPSSKNQRTCIEFNSIDDMINNRENGSGCKNIGYLSHNIRNRQTQSLNTQVYDIQASIKYQVKTRFNMSRVDSIISLNVTQLVLN